MKSSFLLPIVFLFSTFSVSAQQATVQFNIQHAKCREVEITRGDYAKPEVLFEKSRFYTIPLQNGTASWSVNLNEPIFFNVDFYDSIADDYLTYQFYLSPGDDLKFSVDVDDPMETYKMAGKGSEYNHQTINTIFDDEFLGDYFENDSVPFAMMNAIVKTNNSHKEAWKNFNAKHKLKPDFVKTVELYLRYFPTFTYLNRKGEQQFNVGFESYMRNEKIWQHVADSLLAVNPINNPELLQLTDFAYGLTNFVLRTKESVWNNLDLVMDYYQSETKEEAKRLFEKDPENLLMEKIIQKHFSGKTAEFLYADLIKQAIGQKEDNLVEIYERFKQQFPNSENLVYCEKEIKRIEKQLQRVLTDKMVLYNQDKFQTFDEVLEFMKGKTVLLDMWGTWCGPCRSEITGNSDSIKLHFKNQAVDFLYVANYDLKNQDKWKELIAYYNLTGAHILASSALTKSIMDAVKSEGYPTYVIIKRDGTFELSEAGFPMDRDLLIQQLERAMKN